MTSNSINFSTAQGVYELNPKYVKFSWSSTWDNTNRRWNISWTATAQGGYNETAYVQTQNGSITIAAVTGTASGAGTKEMSGPITQTHNDTTILSGSFTLTPTSAGAASFSVEGSVNFWNGNGFSASSLSSTTQALDSVSTASTVSLNVSTKTIGATTDTNITVTVTSTGNYYHLLRYKTDNSSDYVNLWSAENVNNTTKTASITPTNILNKFPSAKSGTLTVECLTYTTSSKTTKVGTTQTATCAITITTANFKPTVSLTNIAVAASNSQGSGEITDALVAGYSTAKTTPTVTAGTGTSIKSITYSVEPGTFAKTSGTATSGTAITTVAMPASSSNYTLTITVTATDARGQTQSANKTATVYGYASPKITTNIYRVASSSSTTRDDAGTYVRIAFSAAVQSTVNSKNSMQSTTCTASGNISGDQTSGTWKALATDKTATFTVTAKDKVSTVTTTVSINPARFALELYDDKNGTLWAQSGGYFKSLKSGSGDDAGVQVRSATSSAAVSMSVKRTDVNREIQLMVGSGGTNRGLYINDGNMNDWLIYYNDTNIVLNKSLDSLSVAGTIRSNGTIGTRGSNILVGKNNDPLFAFYNSDLSTYYGNLTLMTETTNNVTRPYRHCFRIFSYDSTTGERLSNYEQYYLPTVNADRTSNGGYNILTTKSTVSVERGGTGVTTAKGSSKNPVYLSSDGVAACNGFTQLFSGTFDSSSSDRTLASAKANYNYLIIVGKPNSTQTAISSVYVPIAMLTTSDQIFAFANETYGCSVKLKYSGDDVIMAFNASTASNGVVTKVYGGI